MSSNLLRLSDGGDRGYTVKIPAGNGFVMDQTLELKPGNRRLAVERRVPRLLADRCSFRAPRTLLVSESGFEVRQMVPGRCDPWDLFYAASKTPG